MSEPTSIYSFYKLLTEVAKAASFAYYGANADSKAMPPINKHDLELCKDIVNNAIAMFIADAAPCGWRWMRRVMSLSVTGTRVTGTADAGDATSLTDLTLVDAYDADDDLNGWFIYVISGIGIGSQAEITDYDVPTGKVTVAAWLNKDGGSGGVSPAANSTYAITPVETVGGDISRYPLPQNFYGDVTGMIKYAARTGSLSGITWVDESLIRSKRSTSVTSGYPMYAALAQLEPSSSVLSSKRRSEIMFYPEPSDAKTLEFPYTLIFNKLDAETGLAESGGATTLVDTSRDEIDHYFNGWKISIVNGTGLGNSALVTHYASGTFTVGAWLDANGTTSAVNPSSDSVYYVEPVGNIHPAGARFDDAVLAACKYNVSIEYEDAPRDYINQYTQKALPQARLIDARTAPRTLGKDNKSHGATNYRNWTPIVYNE